MSMIIVCVQSKTNCDKKLSPDIRGKWKLMNQVEHWFSHAKIKAVTLVYASVFGEGRGRMLL